VPMLIVMYLFMIRPERKKLSEHAAFLNALKRGDEIALNSGIIGKIHAIEDRVLVVEIADKVRIRVLKQAVSGLAGRFLNPAATPAASPPSPTLGAVDAAKPDQKS
jgi:preprotein translocase subunit YajC